MKLHLTAFVLFALLAGTGLQAQSGFSLASDFGVIRNFKSGQQYWAAGQAVLAQIHVNEKDGIYGMFAYYSHGKLKDNYRAPARLPLTVPAEIGFTNSGKLQTKNISVGYKRWLTGSAVAEKGWNSFATIGTGVILGRIENSFSAFIDTAFYTPPVKAGKGNFKRITLDLSLGIEKPVGADIYLYSECRAFIPVSDYPSPYLPAGKYAPLTATLCLGVRILF